MTLRGKRLWIFPWHLSYLKLGVALCPQKYTYSVGHRYSEEECFRHIGNAILFFNFLSNVIPSTLWTQKFKDYDVNINPRVPLDPGCLPTALSLTAPSSGRKRQFANTTPGKLCRIKKFRLTYSHRENVYDNPFSFILKQHTNNTGHVILFYNRI